MQSHHPWFLEQLTVQELNLPGVFMAIYSALKGVWSRRRFVFPCSSCYLRRVLQVVLGDRLPAASTVLSTDLQSQDRGNRDCRYR